MKKILSNIIFSIVILVCGYLIIANINHILYLNKYDLYDFSQNQMVSIAENIETLESNVEKFSQLTNSTFTADELDEIKSAFNEELANIKSSQLLKYKGKQRIYLKDLLMIDLNTKTNISKNMRILKILAEYDEIVNDFIEVYAYDFISSAYNNDFPFQEVIQAYKYNTRDIFNSNIYESNNVRILARIYSFNYYIVKDNYIVQQALQIGGDNNE